MEIPSQQNHNAVVRDTTPDSVFVARRNELPTPYPFDYSSTSARSGPNQTNPTHCTFAPVQITYYPLPYGQARQQRHEPCPPQQHRYNSTVYPSSYSQHPSSPEQHQGHRFSSDLPGSWSTASNHPGRSLSVSRLEGTDPGDSEHTGGGSSTHVKSLFSAQSYRCSTAEDDADDEGSDAMSDGIASDEGVYSSSCGDRDVFDDEDFGSFGIDSDEEHDSDEYSDS